MRIVTLLSLLLLMLTGTTLAQQPQPADTPLLLHGQLTDTDGTPLADHTIEIWQTDINAIYDHPGDSDPTDLIDFQYFGTATTDENGIYLFLTVIPGEYGSRPVHIHWKVKHDSETLFTSQFYFTEETDFNSDETLLLMLETYTAADESERWRAAGDIVLDLNGNAANTLQPTLSQPEGPFYPVVDFSDYDNNLTDPATDEDPYTVCDNVMLAEAVYGELVDVSCNVEAK